MVESIGIVALLGAVLQGEAATLVGTVRDAESGRPLAGAVVALIDQDRVVVADLAGRYLLRQVGSGPQHIAVRSIGYAPRTLHALVPASGRLEINVTLRPAPARLPVLEVRGAPPIPGSEPSTEVAFPDQAVSRLAIANHPLLAEPDPFLALGRGVVSIRPESPSGVHLRGAAADQTAYVLDGIPVLSPYHTAGLFSAWNPDAVGRLWTTSSAIEATDAIGGIIAGETKTPGRQLAAEGSVGTTQARLTVDGPLGRGGTGFVLGVRSGFPSVMAPPHEGSYLRGGSSDWLATVEGPALGGRLRAIALGSEDEIGATAAAGLPDQTIGLTNDFEWRNQSVGAEWRRTWGATTVRGVGWSASSDASADWAARRGPLRLDAARADRGIQVGLDRRGRGSVTSATLRVNGSRTGYRVTAGSPSGVDRSLEGSVPIVTAIVGRKQSVGRLTLDLGAAIATTGGTSRVGPHARVQWTPTDHLTASVGFDRLHQYSQSIRNPESVVGNIFPVDLFVGSGTPGVPIARSDLGILALDTRPAAGVRLSGQLYRRRSVGVVLAAPRGGEPFSTGEFAVGAGTASGAALDLSVSGTQFGVVASYGWQVARFRVDQTEYHPDQGGRHLFDAGVIAFPSPSSSVRLSVAGQSGRRATAAIGGFEWEACNLRDRGCEFSGSPYVGDGTLGQAVLPGYLRIDLGFRQHWHLRVAGRDASVALFGTFSNLLGRRNLLTYSVDPLTGDRTGVEMRPRAPLVVGLDWRL